MSLRVAGLASGTCDCESRAGISTCCGNVVPQTCGCLVRVPFLFYVFPSCVCHAWRGPKFKSRGSETTLHLGVSKRLGSQRATSPVAAKQRCLDLFAKGERLHGDGDSGRPGLDFAPPAVCDAAQRLAKSDFAPGSAQDIARVENVRTESPSLQSFSCDFNTADSVAMSLIFYWKSRMEDSILWAGRTQYWEVQHG